MSDSVKLITFEIAQQLCNPAGCIGCQRIYSLPPQSFVPCDENHCKEWKSISSEGDRCPHCGKFLAEEVQAPVKKFGCHCDLEPGQTPDECVMDRGDNGNKDCIYAKPGMKKEECKYWREIEEGK